MSEEMNIADMAMAHMRLSQSLRSMSISAEGYKKTEQAIVDLSIAMSDRARRGTRTPRNVFEKKDWVELDEDVSSHCVSGPMGHPEADRVCYYHDRLGVWVFDLKRGQPSKKCLRDHGE